MSGQTVEILNTDAEGRLVLADLLWYVQEQYKVKKVVDIATLTGAIMVALGTEMAGVMGNSQKLIDEIKKAGLISGEEVWQLPINEAYNKMMDSDIADMKKEIKRYTDKGCKDNENITTCGTTMINATGWNYPLARGCVTSEYVGYGQRTDWSGSVSGHHGIDLDCVSEGTTVYGAASGTVARVVYRSSCGGNMVWVYHSVNGTPYTTVYMHLLNISVSEGQTVTPNTKIGEVGGGSTRSYDACTGGTHLHFGMAYGHNAYAFNSHSFNPRNAYNFPALVYNGGGYFSR